MADGRYWSIEHCGWVPSAGTGDALATPWSAHGLPVPSTAAPRDGYDVLRQGRPAAGAPAQAPADVPGQRPAGERESAPR